MTISAELNYAILALDSYNRGYGEGVPDLGDIGATVGNYTIIDQSDTEEGTVGVAASFYAAAYQDTSGNIVISYRGTDALGDVSAWAQGGGFETAQARLAIQFYDQVSQAHSGASNALTGPSLGGGLAA